MAKKKRANKSTFPFSKGAAVNVTMSSGTMVSAVVIDRVPNGAFVRLDRSKRKMFAKWAIVSQPGGPPPSSPASSVTTSLGLKLAAAQAAAAARAPSSTRGPAPAPTKLVEDAQEPELATPLSAAPEPEPAPRLSVFLAEWRLQNCVTQRELSEEAGMGKSRVSAIECAKILPTDDEFLGLVAALSKTDPHHSDDWWLERFEAMRDMDVAHGVRVSGARRGRVPAQKLRVGNSPFESKAATPAQSQAPVASEMITVILDGVRMEGSPADIQKLLDLRKG